MYCPIPRNRKITINLRRADRRFEGLPIARPGPPLTPRHCRLRGISDAYARIVSYTIQTNVYTEIRSGRPAQRLAFLRDCRTLLIADARERRSFHSALRPLLRLERAHVRNRYVFNEFVMFKKLSGNHSEYVHIRAYFVVANFVISRRNRRLQRPRGFRQSNRINTNTMQRDSNVIILLSPET